MKHYFQKNDTGKLGTKGFYVALGVCLIAIGVAAWTTYDSVINYANPQEQSQSSEPVQNANNTVSGVFAMPQESEVPESKEPEAPSSSEPEQSKAESEVPAKEAAAQPQKFVFPVGSTVLKPFSGDNPVYSKTMKDWRVHAGVDFSAKEGEEVKSIAEGTVKDVYTDEVFGKVVYVVYGEIGAAYCGLKETSVKAGDTVTEGQKVGTVGAVPCESEEDSHFHFAIKQDGKWIDPMTVLK